MTLSDPDMPELGETVRDRGVVLAKGVVGMIPGVGSILGEVLGTLIREQRMERLEEYVRKLEARLSVHDGERFRADLRDPERVDLFEEGAQQSVRALSEDRRAYIASVVAGGMSGDERAKIEAKRLLRLLAQIDDDQIVILASELSRHDESLGSDFHERHAAVLDPVRAHFGSDDEAFERETLYELARVELVRFGLLRSRFKAPKKGETPEFDAKTGTLKSGSRELTPLGRMLLVRIGLAEPGEF